MLVLVLATVGQGVEQTRARKGFDPALAAFPLCAQRKTKRPETTLYFNVQFKRCLITCT